MTSRERALAAYAFQTTDRPCLDLMEGTVWPELAADFAARYDLRDDEAIQEALGSDFRWSIFKTVISPYPQSPEYTGNGTFSDAFEKPLSKAQTPEDVYALFQPDAARVVLPDFEAVRARYPDMALVCCPGWMPCFSGACDDFGMEKAMTLLVEAPEVIEAYVRIKGQYALEVVRRCLREGAVRYYDFFWLGDDFSGESSMLLSPGMWRRFFKEALRAQVQEIRDAGMPVMFHSCGDVGAVYEDFIEMGISSHCGVQTSCPGMSAKELAEKIGGRLVIHGGVDAQRTLVSGSVAEVARETRRNIEAFADCGGYVVSNSHHTLMDIGAEKLAAMALGAGRWQGADV